MADDPKSTLFDPRDLSRAVALLTRLPAPGADAQRAAASAWAWPLVGAIVGGLAGLLGWLAASLGLPPSVTAGLILGASMVMTGALHEDGLADCADGFWGGHDPEQRLNIMKDSRIGAYGVLALIIVTGLNWAALSTMVAAGALWMAALVPAALGRASMAGVMAAMPYARQDGLARHVGKPSKTTAGVGFFAAALGTVVFCGMAGITAVAAVAIVSIAVTRLASAKIGGQTGDVLGATQQLTTLAALLALLLFFPA